MIEIKRHDRLTGAEPHAEPCVESDAEPHAGRARPRTTARTATDAQDFVETDATGRFA